jgi:two-component system, NarL family, sensor histidine kinase DesK
MRDEPRHRTRWVFLAYLLLYPLPWLNRPPDTGAVVLSAVGLAVFLPVYLAGSQCEGWRSAGAALVILALGFALQPAGGAWGVFAIYAAAMAAATRPARLGLRTLLGVALAYLAFVAWRQPSPWEWGSTVFFGAITALAALHQATLWAKNLELAASREEAHRLAVAAERERISRDVHDLLGHTLTLVAVKADLAGRLLDRDPARARAEVEEIRLAARGGLADLRAAITGLRATSLEAELAGARHALATADVALDSQLTAGALPPEVELALAFVLREATTNVVRHAGASRCRVRVERSGAQAVLEVRDDGRGGAGVREGHGLRGVRERLAPLAGTLSLSDDGGTVLTARVPLPPTEAA